MSSESLDIKDEAESFLPGDAELQSTTSRGCNSKIAVLKAIFITIICNVCVIVVTLMIQNNHQSLEERCTEAMAAYCTLHSRCGP